MTPTLPGTSPREATLAPQAGQKPRSIAGCVSVGPCHHRGTRQSLAVRTRAQVREIRLTCRGEPDIAAYTTAVHITPRSRASCANELGRLPIQHPAGGGGRYRHSASNSPLVVNAPSRRPTHSQSRRRIRLPSAENEQGDRRSTGDHCSGDGGCCWPDVAGGGVGVEVPGWAGPAWTGG